MAGFECSSHRRKTGRRLDLIGATCHDTHAVRDYRRCAELGLRTVRDGLRWHLIETAPGVYDWSSWLPMLLGAQRAGVRVIWDLYHYGAPDHLDPGAADFPAAFARFAAEAVKVHRRETGLPPLLCPVNEISFFAWAVDVGYFPAVAGMAKGAFKRQLVRCAVAGVQAMRAVDPDCRFFWAEPLIHVAPRNRRSSEIRRAEAYRQAQFEAYDLLTGRAEPELGGQPDLVDAIGLNFYPHNQWYFNGPTIPMGHHEYRSLAEMLVEVAARFDKPIFIAETGAEGSARAAWLHYICDEARQAMARGADLKALCLYPVTAYPGWDNGRHCEVGLFSPVLADGERRLYAPLAQELERQRALFGEVLAAPRPRMAMG